MGASNKERLVYLAAAALIIYWLLGILAALSFVYSGKPVQWLIVAITLVLLYPLNAGLKEMTNRIEGIKGEFKVSTILHEMWPEGVRSVDDVVLEKNRGNIDHIAVSKTGVWTIETKYIDGNITMVKEGLAKNGKPFPKDYLKQAYAEASAVRKYLASKGMGNLTVRPILVFAGPYAKVRFGMTEIKGVFVIGSLGLRQLIVGPDFARYLSQAEITKTIKLFDNFKAE